MRKTDENCQIDGRKQERTFGGSAYREARTTTDSMKVLWRKLLKR